jgi:pimeloyl-ACP methyl ester carboxylesterase
MISVQDLTLPHGITLHCRVSGVAGRPTLIFLHGFPEVAFIWDALLLYFSRPENGGYRCVALELRGCGASSRPAQVTAYRAKHLVQQAASQYMHFCAGPMPRRCWAPGTRGHGVAAFFAIKTIATRA